MDKKKETSLKELLSKAGTSKLTAAEIIEMLNRKFELFVLDDEAQKACKAIARNMIPVFYNIEDYVRLYFQEKYNYEVEFNSGIWEIIFQLHQFEKTLEANE